MGDYNDGRLPEPCLRLPYGGSECASVELGDGTGFVRVSDCEMLMGLVADMFAVLKQLIECELVCEHSWHKGGRCNGFGASCVFAKRMADMGIEAGCNRTPEEPPLCCDPELDDSAMLRLHDRMNVVLKRLGADDVHAVAEAHEIIEDAARIGSEGR